MVDGRIVFLQMRAHRAGAQTSLFRLLASGRIDDLRPVVVTAGSGWLVTALEARQIAVEVLEFPSSRSLGARLIGNRAFARHVVKRVGKIHAVIANDHPEALLAQAVAAAAKAPWQVILRTAGSTPRDLAKYRVREAARVWAVGAALRDTAATALTRDVDAYAEGLLDDEWAPDRPWSGFRGRILLAGHEGPGKGWADFVAALDELPSDLPDLLIRATGARPDYAPSQGRHHFEWLGRVDDFPGLVRDHDLVVHPARAESFGLAPIEAWAAGVPALASRVGVLAESPVPDPFGHPPGDVGALAHQLTTIVRQWKDLGPIVASIRAELRPQVCLTDRVEPFVRALRAGG